MLTTHNSIKLAIFGSKSVGKTAVVVRYLTKRFIGEYDSDSDHIYKNPIKSFIMRRHVKILDTSGDFADKNDEEISEILDWANGFVVVYDISNRSTFHTAVKAINVIKHRRRSHSLPITLIANKSDLEVGRKVSVSEATSFADQASAVFFEISAADSFDAVKQAMDSCLDSASKCCNTYSTRNLHEVAKLSHHVVYSPLHHFIETVLCQRKDSLSQKIVRLSKRGSRSPTPSRTTSKKSNKSQTV